VRQITQTKQFKRDFKKIAASDRYSEKNFFTVVELLAQDMPLSARYRDHNLLGEWNGCRECHIQSDWLLIYRKYDRNLVLIRTGSHSELF
jgi:mRNA interferase YafQ